MGLFNRLFGYRWSLYVVLDDNQLIYAMHQDSVTRILGYVMEYFADGGKPTERWSLHLNFNKRHHAIKLGPEHFTPGGTAITPALVQAIAATDPGWNVPGGKPVFIEVATGKHLKIGEGTPGKIDIQAMLDNINKPRELTFFFVMDKVFGKS